MTLEKDLQIRDKIIKTFNDFPKDDMFGEVLEIILENLKSRFGVFGYIDDNGDLICPSMTRDVWDECKIQDKDIIFPRETWENRPTIWARALIEGTSNFSNKEFNVPKGHIPIARSIAVPIKSQDEVIGLLVVGNKKSDYTKNDVELLETFATYIGPILKLRLEKKISKKEHQKLKESLHILKKSKTNLDEIDKQIINELCLDGRKSPVHMKVNSKRKKMSHTGIKNRIMKLEDLNILKIQGNININNLGLRMALINIEFNNYDSIDNYINKYGKCPRIFFLSKLTGKYHIIIGIVGKSLEDLNNFINYCLLTERMLIKSSDITFASEITKPQYIPMSIFNIDNHKTICGKNCLDCTALKKKMCAGCDFL